MPSFNKHGNLPPGIHRASWKEVAERFGTTPHRKKLLETLEKLDRIPRASRFSGEKRQLERDAVTAQLEDLLGELRTYEKLKRGQPRILRANSVEGLATLLIKARIALQLTQKDLADRLGVKEQQVQRYEATEYSSASLERVGEVARVLGLEVSVGAPLPRRKDEKRQVATG